MDAAMLAERIREYLGNGGLFNPELMDHEKVRDLLTDVLAHLDVADPGGAQCQDEFSEEDRKVLIAAVHAAGNRMAIAQNGEIARLKAELAAEKDKNAYRRCTCDDHVDSTCPVHRRENELQNLWLASRTQLEKLVAELQWHSRYWRGMEKMPYNTGPTSEITLREMARKNADRIDAVLQQTGERIQ